MRLANVIVYPEALPVFRRLGVETTDVSGQVLMYQPTTCALRTWFLWRVIVHLSSNLLSSVHQLFLNLIRDSIYLLAWTSPSLYSCFFRVSSVFKSTLYLLSIVSEIVKIYQRRKKNWSWDVKDRQRVLLIKLCIRGIAGKSIFDNLMAAAKSKNISLTVRW
jgi:hypothetical protein